MRGVRSTHRRRLKVERRWRIVNAFSESRWGGRGGLPSASVYVGRADNPRDKTFSFVASTVLDHKFSK